MTDVNTNISEGVASTAEPAVNESVANANPAETEPAEVQAQETQQEPAEPVKAEPAKPTPKNNGGRKTKADLQAQINLLQAELNNVVDNSADFNNQLSAKDTEISGLKTEIENYKAEVTSLTEALNSVIESKKNALPENLKALIPEGKNAIETLNWLLKAETNNPVEKPQIPIGRITPIDNKQANAQNMSAYDKMTSAFAQLFKK